MPRPVHDRPHRSVHAGVRRLPVLIVAAALFVAACEHAPPAEPLGPLQALTGVASDKVVLVGFTSAPGAAEVAPHLGVADVIVDVVHPQGFAAIGGGKIYSPDKSKLIDTFKPISAGSLRTESAPAPNSTTIPVSVVVLLIAALTIGGFEGRRFDVVCAHSSGLLSLLRPRPRLLRVEFRVVEVGD